MMFRVTYDRVQDDGVTMEVWATAVSKTGSRPIHFAVRRYTGPLGLYPGCTTPVQEHELHRLASARGTVTVCEGISVEKAHDMAWDVGVHQRAGKDPAGEWKVWNLAKSA